MCYYLRKAKRVAAVSMLAVIMAAGSFAAQIVSAPKREPARIAGHTAMTAVRQEYEADPSDPGALTYRRQVSVRRSAAAFSAKGAELVNPKEAMLEEVRSDLEEMSEGSLGEERGAQDGARKDSIEEVVRREALLAANPPMSAEEASLVISAAERWLGTPYLAGGTGPDGFDCSGFVLRVLQSCGYDVWQRTCIDQYLMCVPISEEEACPGDLVFFDGTVANGYEITHVGLYAGGGRMIHAGSAGIVNVDLGIDYWQSHMYGYGRLIRRTP